MGYYSQVEFNVKVRKDKINEIREEIRRLIEENEEKQMTCIGCEGAEGLEFVEYWLKGMEIDDDGDILLDDYYIKPNYDEDFARWLSKYADKGTIRLIGDGGEQWGYWFDGKGNYGELEYKEIWIGYGEKMPKKEVTEKQKKEAREIEKLLIEMKKLLDKEANIKEKMAETVERLDDKMEFMDVEINTIEDIALIELSLKLKTGSIDKSKIEHLMNAFDGIFNDYHIRAGFDFDNEGEIEPYVVVTLEGSMEIGNKGD